MRYIQLTIIFFCAVFEPEELNKQVVAATEKQLHSAEHQHTTTIEEHIDHPKRTEL